MTVISNDSLHRSIFNTNKTILNRVVISRADERKGCLQGLKFDLD